MKPPSEAPLCAALHAGDFQLPLLAGVIAFSLLAPSTGFTADSPPDTRARAPATHAPPAPALDSKSQKAAPTAFAAAEPRSVLQWGIGNGKSYWVPAADIVGFDYLLNRYDHYVVDDEVYGSPTSNLRQNLRKKWIVDTDPFAVNQLFHPYQGSMYQGFARSAGLGFWEASAYTWEVQCGNWRANTLRRPSTIRSRPASAETF